MAFLGERAFEQGAWDEPGLWLSVAGYKRPDKPETLNLQPDVPAVLRNVPHRSWAYLRLARFTSRPGHADQLHLDVWWRGLNVARDAGTYLYNGPSPLDNSLAGTPVHNTVSLNHQDQMQRFGRFLWLDWAQAKLVAREKAQDATWERIVGEHDGYHRLGVTHQRSVTAWAGGKWVVEDHLFQAKSSRRRADGSQKSLTCQLHWLLPDWEFDEVRGSRFEIRLLSPFGWVKVRIDQVNQSLLSDIDSLECQIVRGGRLISGAGIAHPTLGWFSPTYGYKEPALSVLATTRGRLPIRLLTEFEFPEVET
jgi:hypothetical protein